MVSFALLSVPLVGTPEGLPVTVLPIPKLSVHSEGLPFNAKNLLSPPRLLATITPAVPLTPVTKLPNLLTRLRTLPVDLRQLFTLFLDAPTLEHAVPFVLLPPASTIALILIR